MKGFSALKTNPKVKKVDYTSVLPPACDGDTQANDLVLFTEWRSVDEH
jgi:hypothetical protein